MASEIEEEEEIRRRAVLLHHCARVLRTVAHAVKDSLRCVV